MKFQNFRLKEIIEQPCGDFSFLASVDVVGAGGDLLKTIDFYNCDNTGWFQALTGEKATENFMREVRKFLALEKKGRLEFCVAERRVCVEKKNTIHNDSGYHGIYELMHMCWSNPKRAKGMSMFGDPTENCEHKFTSAIPRTMGGHYAKCNHCGMICRTVWEHKYKD